MTPVLDEQGNQVYYTEGAMNGKPKHMISHERKYERLNLYIWLNPCDQKERLQYKNTIALAEKIRYEREQEFLEDREGYRLQKEKEPNFHDFFRRLYSEESTATKSCKTSYRLIHNRFIKYLNSVPKFQKYAVFIRFDNLTNDIVAGFAEWLKGICAGEGARKSFFYFKKAGTIAVEEGSIKKNPCKGIMLRCDTNVLTKSIRHCARHSFAVNLLNAGANIKTVSSLLGHSSIKMTEKYLHVIDSQKKDAMHGLGRINFKRETVYHTSEEDTAQQE